MTDQPDPPISASLFPATTPFTQAQSVTPSSTSSNWVELCSSDDVSTKGLYPFDLDRDGFTFPLLVIRTIGGLYALHDECPHRRVPISESGYLDGQVVHCGWHHWGFSVETGEHTIPTGNCVERFDVKEENGLVWINLTPSSS